MSMMPNLLSIDAEAAIRAIPPLWPLATSVAVNPFIGQTNERLADAAARLGRAAGIPLTMPRAWYAERIASGEISDDDLAGAIAGLPQLDLGALKQAARIDRPAPPPLPTIADLLARASSTDWPAIIDDRIGAFAAAYFDEGQALWAMPRQYGAYAAWRDHAIHDLTPEIMGLSGFAAFVSAAPQTAADALPWACARLGLESAGAASYFHRLLMALGGWAQLARYRLWQAELAQSSDQSLLDLLVIRLIWEVALLDHGGAALASAWRQAAEDYASPIDADDELRIDEALQTAAERAGQRRLAEALQAPHEAPPAPPQLQAAFCIDVRSERFRRALENTDPAIETIGFAGFFGIGAAHRRFASDVIEHRLPVLLNPAHTTRAGGAEDQAADTSARIAARGRRAWGRFKLAAVSSFAFVEAAGPAYIVKLVRDALAMGGVEKVDDAAPRPDPALPIEVRVATAEGVLRAMSLTRDFAPLVLLIGHGAGVTNNPHASGLHCGACGGHAGDVNARLLAALLNDDAVREALAPRGIAIPAATLFVAGLHDTTADKVQLFDRDYPAIGHKAALIRARHWLTAAGEMVRRERRPMLTGASATADPARRGADWAQVRPEWGLAGCSAFIAAPRQRTRGIDLAGRAFLHDYDWRADQGFGVLELILTAPVVVASWISLQYYGSAVAPGVFGGGDKLIHNVVGGIGVVEGNGGMLRGGLPWQSVHDGGRLMHEPLRLSVYVEAPNQPISDILARHPMVRALFDNGWLHLLTLDEQGRPAWRYDRGTWQRLIEQQEIAAPIPELA